MTTLTIGQRVRWQGHEAMVTGIVDRYGSEYGPMGRQVSVCLWVYDAIWERHQVEVPVREVEAG